MFRLSTFFGKPARKNRIAVQKRPTNRPSLEQLEDRLIPSVSPIDGGTLMTSVGTGWETTSGASNRRIASAANGNYAAVWQDQGVWVQLYSKQGNPLTPRQKITGTSSKDSGATIAMNSRGAFLVAWTNPYSATDRDVLALRFDSTGRAQGGILNAAYTTNQEYAPSVAMDASGNFVIAYTFQLRDSTRSQVRARQFYASGAARGGEITVANDTYDENYQPSVAMNPAGAFVVAFTHNRHGYYGDDLDVYAQRYSPGGASQEGRLAVATTGAWELDPAVGIDRAGNFVVAYTTGRLTSNEDVKATMFGTSGGAYRILSVTISGQHENSPSISMDADGNFAIVYKSNWSSTDTDIRGKYFNAGGVQQGGELGIATSYDPEIIPSVALDGKGGMVALWNRTGANRGTWTRRYEGANVVRPITQMTYNTDYIWLNQDVNGHAQLVLFSNGAYNFTGVFHDHAFFSSYGVTLTIGVVSATNTMYTFRFSGHVSGYWAIGPSDVSWNYSGVNPALAAGWQDIVDGRWYWRAEASYDFAALIDALKRSAATVATVVAIVS